MRKHLFLGLIGLLVVILAACGSSATAVPAAKQAPAAPVAAAQPAAPVAGQTKLVTKGQKFKMQLAVITRGNDDFARFEQYAKRVYDRTEGQVDISLTSYPELGISGPDTVQQMRDGTIPFLELYSGYIGGDLPITDMNNLWGMYDDIETQLKAIDAVKEEIAKVIDEHNGVIISYGYRPNNYFYSKKPLTKLADFKGLKTRTHSTVLNDLLKGLDAEGQFMTFSEVYTALERGILDAGITVLDAGYGQRWYEVTKNLTGPIVAIAQTWYTMNKDEFNKLPADIQAIMLEEGVVTDRQSRKETLAAAEANIQKHVKEGMTVSDWPEDVKPILKETAINIILPNWVKRAGGPNSEAVKIFNQKISPILGVKVNPDGTAGFIGKAPAAAAQPAVPAAAAAPTALAAYAAQYAGKPGAVYVGDINQLVGPAATKDEGGLDGNVPLDALQRHLYIYKSPYYQGILEKANLTNPAKLVSTGAKITIQHTCINRTLLHCKIVESFFAPNLDKRTNGQVKLTITSQPELGIGGTDSLRLVQDGTLAMADIYSGFVAGDLPQIEIQSLWGMFPDNQAQYDATVAVTPDLEKLVRDATGGSFIINHNWVAGIDQYFFCNTKILSLADFKGKKTRSHGAAISDWIEGMGASAQFVPFGDVYTALERGILDCGVTGANPAYGQRWYEVSKYLNGPLVSFFNTNNVINKDLWNKIPADLQQIMIEEGAKTELEAMRLASIQNETGTTLLLNAGMELVEFSPALKDHSYNVAVLQKVIPNWVKRVGGADKPFVKIFNEKITPIVGLRIEPNGSVTKVPVTKVR